MTGAGRTALIAGRGALAAAVAAAMPERPLVAALEGSLPEGLTVDSTFRVERLALFLRWLEDEGVTRVVFAGATDRPRLDPALIDPATAQLLPRLMAGMQAGDDATLRVVIGLFEDAGFVVAGVQDVAPALVAHSGVLCGAPTDADRRDATRADAIVAALGAVDVGQGAVVAQGLCLAVETLPGTDAMLAWVAATARREGQQAARGVLYKAPKPGQDRRIDLPTIGVETVRRAAAAGLAGLAWQAGEVILLDPDAMLAEARVHGLFLWAREP